MKLNSYFCYGVTSTTRKPTTKKTSWWESKAAEELATEFASQNILEIINICVRTRLRHSREMASCNIDFLPQRLQKKHKFVVSVFTSAGNVNHPCVIHYYDSYQ